MGNPKKQSRFICLRCLNENLVGQHIQRKNQREYAHIKDLTCLCTMLKEQTKNLEVRYCDDYKRMMVEANTLHTKYYGRLG
jgi:hypothetical protein